MLQFCSLLKVTFLFHFYKNIPVINCR